MTSLRSVGLAAALCSLFLVAADTPHSDALLWQYRNLGKAFYENPDTHLQSVQELRKALDLEPASVREQINYSLALLRAGKTEDGVALLLKAQKQDPSLPYTWFNLGIAYKHAGDYAHAIEQFRGLLRLVPDEPIAHYNLASVFRSQGDLAAALPEFLAAAKLNESLAGPHFQLFTLYQRMGDKESAARERKLFEEAKQKNEGAAVPEDMEWCFYAELYDPPVHRPAAEAEQTRYQDRLLAKDWDPSASHILLLDSDGLGDADVLVWSPQRLSLYKHGSLQEAEAGLSGLHDIRTAAVGDFDNDGLPDLCVVTGSAVVLLHNDGGKFSKRDELPPAPGATQALWLDYDHDYDLDLLLFGPHPVLLRNDGHGKFEEHTAGFPFVPGHALDAVIFAIRGDTAARDVVVSYADRVATLYRDRLNGVFEASDIPAIPAGSSQLLVTDINRDGLLDLVSYSPAIHAFLNVAKSVDAPAVFDSVSPAQTGRWQVPPSASLADLNGDHRQDYVRILPDGTLHVFTNASPDQRWVSVQIHGIKNIKQAVGATVEMKSGAYYDKQIFAGIPLSFAIDSRTDVDTIRITWPNGLIQNEPHQKGNELLKIAEAQRLSGSCPMIFTWNGSQFQFITDVLGVAPLGASSGDGHYFPVDHDEYIQIPGAALKPVAGRYQVHITEELHEVSYLDQLRLIAVDHPAAESVYTNDKFKSPPYPEFRLFGSQKKIHPLRAVDAHGIDATARVARQDYAYPDAFAHNQSGVAELHTLDLDFGKSAPDNRAALVLNGWVDWADGSTFLGAFQNGQGLVFPYLQVKNDAGQWQTVIADMGIPSGKPKTIVVDLTGKFLSASRQVRIVTNLCVYWDEISLLDDSSAPRVKLTPLQVASADLHFRGFSKVVVDPARQQPERFLYDQVRPVSNWNPTPGLYTRYGDVRSLTTQVDDRLVVMGSGDELKLEFSAADLPALPAGWSRDFLLLVDGWAKDSDANTAFSQSVTPLPFHAMSAYPYKKNEAFPSDRAHAQYLRDYLTRPALRLIQPLVPVYSGD